MSSTLLALAEMNGESEVILLKKKKKKKNLLTNSM